MEGGTFATQAIAKQLAKSYLTVQVDGGIAADMASSALLWLGENGIKTLNVAGPRESKRPSICILTGELLQAVDAAHRSNVQAHERKRS